MKAVRNSLIWLVISFIVILVILWLTKPKFVLTSDSTSTNKKLAWDKVVAYSALIAILIAIIVLLVMQGKERKAASPSYGSRFRYCGMGH